ncbi:MAG: ABC transporter substrate-binding protein [Myxococcota bacterium]
MVSLLALALSAAPADVAAALAHIERDARVALAADGSASRLRTLLEHYLDFHALAEYALDPEWSRLDRKKRERFVSLLREVVVLQVEARIKRPVEFAVEVKRQQEAGDYVGVFAVLNPDAPDPIDLTLTLRERDHWRVVDVSVDGSSLAKSYRDELLGLLTRAGFRAILKALADKKKQLSR